MAILRKSMVWLLIATQLWMPGLARAQIQKPTFPIVVDKSGGSKPPVVGVSGNGVPVVNIAPPSNSGVSNNRYTQFNVGPSGVILNNSGTSSQTQLGGAVGGNALLGRTPAKVILNQVTAANPSQLLGTLEVAGGRANVIVANPAGITCNGCGFLNANRATFTTGRPMMGEDGSLRGFDVAGGAITFTGQGFNGRNLSRVDIWTRSLALNAQVWADHLDIVAGVASVDYLSGNATEKNNPGPAPAFALDVAALGGMYANSIRLVGTEAGLGVNVGGNLAAANRLELTAQGDVRIARKAHVQVAGPMSLHTAGTLTNSGVVTADGGLIAKGQRLKNSGTLIAGNTKKNTAGMQLMFADQHHIGTLRSAGDITVGADRLNAGSGLIFAKGALTLKTSGLMKHGNAEIHGYAVALQASALHSANGKIESDTDLELSVEGLVRNQGGTFKAKRDLTLVAGSWENRGLIQAGQDLNLRGDRAHNRKTGQIIGGSTTSVHSDALTNAGLIQAAHDLDMQSKRVHILQDGRIVAGATSNLHIDTLDNAGLIQARQDLNLRGDSATNQRTGQVVAGAKADVQSKVLHNAGLIDSGMTRLDAGEIVNTGEIYGDAIAIPANSLRNGRQGAEAGVIAARGDLDLGVTSLVNQDNARILVGGDLRLGGQLDAESRAKGVVKSIENAAAAIEVTGDAMINSASLKNQEGLIAAKGALALTTSGVMEHSRAVLYGKKVDLQASVLHATDSKIESGTDLQLNAHGLVHQQGGALLAQRDLVLVAKQVNNTGVIHGGQNLSLRSDRADNGKTGQIIGGSKTRVHSDALTNAGLIQTDQDLDIQSKRVHILQDGRIVAGATSNLHIDTLDNAGLVHAGQYLNLRGDSAANQHTGRILAGAKADVQSKVLRNAGLIDSGMTRLDAGEIVNTGEIYGDAIAIPANSLRNGRQGAMAGVIAARGDLDLGVASLVNQDGARIRATGGLRLGGELNAEDRAHGIVGSLENTSAVIEVEGDAVIHAATLKNRGGLVWAGGALALTTSALMELSQAELWGDTVDLQAAVLHISDSKIESDTDLQLRVDGLVRHVGSTLKAQRDLTLDAGQVDNRGLIQAGRDLKLRGERVRNQPEGRILSGAQANLHSNTLNNAGLIDGQVTQLVAGHVVNTGKIYGDAIAIQANSLRNDKHGATAGVIAARGDLDLGVATLVNREHALIYVGGDLRLGGELDAAGRAQGVARSVKNASATIDVVGDSVIRSASVNNLNDHYESELTEVSRENKAYYIPDQTTTMMPAEDAWFCHIVSGQCSKDFNWLGNDGRKQLLLPSDRYPDTRYGPPFDYSPEVRTGFFLGKSKPGVDGPVALNYHTEFVGVIDKDSEGETRIVTRYKPGEKIWSVFGVNEPQSMPDPVMTTGGGFREETEASKQLRASITASNDVLHKALDAEIRAFNQDFYGRLRDRIYFINVNEVTIEDRVTKTDPGKLLIGGNATIQGAVFNDKSQIAAAGALRIDGPAMVNQSARSTQRIEQTGTSVYTEWNKGRYYSPSTPYTNTFSRDIEPKAAEPQRGTPHKFPAATLVDVSMPGEGGVRVPIMPPVVPDNAMFRVNQVADASYLVSVDAQFLSPRHATSSPEARSLVALVEPQEGVADSARVSTLPQVMPGDLMSRLASETGAPKATANNALVQEPRNVVSSNELLRALNADTTHILKRLGDGFYEQQLIAQQILLAKGQRLTGDYTSGQAQYRALLLAGAEFANQHKLTIGAALTEAQMRVLTSDIVWLVEQTIVLPDGSAHKVLSPQVYLVVKPTDLKGDGTLIAGRDLNITSSGAISNSGTLVAGQRADLQAKTIQNTVGAMQAGNLALNAQDDIFNQSGRIQGDSVSLVAGRDVTLNSEATRFAGSHVNNTAITGVLRLDAGELTIKAGRDLNAQAALISASGDATLQAGRDVNLTTLTESFHMSWQANARNKGKLGVSEEHGTQLSAGGKLALLAGQDFTTRAASINVEQALSIGAGRDITLGAGERTEYSATELFSKRKRFLSRSSRHTIRESSTTQAQGTSVNADSVTMMAGRNTNILGSDVAVEHDQLISAGQDLTIAAAQNKFESFHYERRKKSGLMSGGGGLSISIGTQENGQKNRSVVTQAAPSTVGSIQGDLRLIAGNDYVQTGSNVLALNGDIDILGRNVTIQEAREARTQTDQSWFKKTGLTIGVSNPVVSLAQTASDMAQAAGKTRDGRMKLLAAATVGLAGKNAYDATNGGDPAAAAAVNLSISLGTSKSFSQSISTSDTAASSTVLAGGDLTLLASGASQDSAITVTGSKLSAGGNAILKADGDILLQAAKNVSELHSSNKSSGGSIGVGLSAGSSGAGVLVSASAHTGRGKADGVDAIWTNTQINAGHVLALQSGEDTTLRGASGRAERVVASVGGKLLIESLQDTSAYKSKNQNASASVSVCVAGACGNSISGNVSQTKMNSDFASVIEQSGLWAGNGGFQIDVDKNTSLIGGLIASNDQAIRDGLNRLDTGTLVVKDIENKAEYSASSVGVGGGYSFGGGSQTKNDLGVNQKGEVVAGANAVPGTSVPKDRNGLSVGMPMVAAASDSARSMTLSAISEGQIRIRDEAGQQALTGKTAAQTIAGLNRDTEDTLNSLSPIFNKEEIEAGFEIASEASRQVGQFLTNRAKEKQAAEKALSDAIATGRSDDAARVSALMDQLQHAQDWSAGGKYGLAMLALSGAGGANVTGSTIAFVQSAAVNYLQGLGASKVKRIADSLGTGAQAEVARAALHSIVGCAGAAGKGAGCASGALGAGVGSVLNSLMGSPEGLTAQEAEARRNLVMSLVAGITAAARGEATTASTAAALETSQNWGFLKPALEVAGAAASACATNANCQRAVTYAADKTVYVVVQMKDGVIYVGSAALVGIAAASDTVGAWVSDFVDGIVGNDTVLPGKPGEVVHVVTPPPLPSEQGVFGSEIPVWPGELIGPIAVPGQENNGPLDGITMTTPLPEEQGPELIFSEGVEAENSASNVPVYNPQGALRAAAHSGNWSSGSLNETVQTVVGSNPEVTYTTSGKTVYTNPTTGMSVVYDNAGDYYRVQNAAGQYLDQSGNVMPNNVPLIGPNKTTQTGVPSSVRNGLTHFKNSDVSN